MNLVCLVTTLLVATRIGFASPPVGLLLPEVTM
jgi:hypothetical protein